MNYLHQRLYHPNSNSVKIATSQEEIQEYLDQGWLLENPHGFPRTDVVDEDEEVSEDE